MAACELLFIGLLTQTLASTVPPVATPRYTTIPFSALSKAMLGVDPILANPLGKKDTGLKDQIFVPSTSFRDCEGTIQLNDFIGKAVQDVRCSRISVSSMRTASNFNEYMKMMNDSISFTLHGRISVGFWIFRRNLSFRFASSSNNYEQKHREFFQKTQGELVRGGAHCQTHVVSVNLNTKPVFTENFLSGLRKLNFASQNPSSQISLQMFRDFVQNFGTHFQDVTTLGSKLVIEKLFATKAASRAENTRRQRCVSSSFTRNLGKNSLFVQTEQHFSQDANKCSDSQQANDVFNSLGLSSERIITIGTPPYSDQDTWAEHALKSPVPIHYNLEKISHMFVQDWFEDSFPEERFNGTAMRDFFETHSRQYCEIMFGAPCSLNRTGCGYNSNCKLWEKCIDDQSVDGFTCRKGCGITSDCFNQTVCKNDDSLVGFQCVPPCSVPHLACSAGEACYVEPHSAKGYICVPTKPGKAVIAGGRMKIRGKYGPVEEVEHLNYKPFPALSRPVAYQAIAKSGEYLYMCGGKEKDYWGQEHERDECYRIHTRYPEDRWEGIRSAPIKMGFPSAVSISNVFIWFIYRFTLVKFNTETNTFSTTALPFDANTFHCSVTNGTHVYVIGAGTGNNEIWTNRNSMNETEWQLAGHVRVPRIAHSCLWYGSNIIITGGQTSGGAVEMFNTETWQVWRGKDLSIALHAHRMMMHDGMPTVIGGWRSGSSNILESFSIAENKWVRQSVQLTNAKDNFALVEV